MPEHTAIRTAATEETAEEANLPAAGRARPAVSVESVCERQDGTEASSTQQQHQLDGLRSLYCNLAQVEQNFAPDIPLTESHMYKISGHLATSWKELSMTELGLDQKELKRIDSDYREVQEKAYEALKCWRRTETSNATVGWMMTALQNINRCDVKKVLKDAIKNDVTLPHTPPTTAVPPESGPNAAPVEEPEYNQTERREQRVVVRPSQAFDAEQIQRLGGILDQLHGAVQKLTQSDVRGRIVNEIQSLLKVQEFYEEQIRTMIVNSMFLRIEDDEIAADLKERQEIRTSQREQTRKFFEKIHADKICKKCKLCKDCNEGRRNTFATSGPRPKIKTEPRQTRSLYDDRDGAAQIDKIA